MKKTILRCILYCSALWIFSAFAIAGPVQDKGQPRCVSHDMEILRPALTRPCFGQNDITPRTHLYTKLNRGGHPLPDSAAVWLMVKDNVTGLIWEVKQHMDGVSRYDDPNDADNAYTWYDGNPDTNGGNSGTSGNGMNTEAFISAINRAQYGGYSDWRLPVIKELAYLADMSRKNPSINTIYFPNTASSWYWSSSTSANDSLQAWGVGFNHGYDSYNYKYIHGYVRAVRGERQRSEAAYGMISGFVSFVLP